MPQPQQPSALFYIVGFVALALLIAGLLLSAQNNSPGVAAGATGIGAVGFAICYWLQRRQ